MPPLLLHERSFFMVMKIVRFNCCGMDVHKNLVIATIGITDRKTNITEYFQRSFSTLNSDLYRLKDWLRSHHCSDVCMESTGKYWIPIFNILEDEINVHLRSEEHTSELQSRIELVCCLLLEKINNSTWLTFM